MPLGFGEIAVLGVVGAAVFLGPKRIIPKVAETLKVAREAFADSAKTATTKTTMKPPAPIETPKKPE